MTVPDLPHGLFRTRFRPTTMTTHDNRWNFATVLAQSVLLFFLVFFVSVITEALYFQYAHIIGDMYLPTPLRWMRAIVPKEEAGMIGLAATLALTNLCAGIMLQATAPTPEIATRRTLFLVTTTWGLVFVGIAFSAIAFILPMIPNIKGLGSEADIAAASASSRVWIVWMMLYLPALAALTFLVCKRFSSRRPADPNVS